MVRLNPPPAIRQYRLSFLTIGQPYPCPPTTVSESLRVHGHADCVARYIHTIYESRLAFQECCGACSDNQTFADICPLIGLRSLSGIHFEIQNRERSLPPYFEAETYSGRNQWHKADIVTYQPLFLHAHPYVSITHHSDHSEDKRHHLLLYSSLLTWQLADRSTELPGASYWPLARFRDLPQKSKIRCQG